MRVASIPAYYFTRPLPYAPTLAVMEQWVSARIENRVGDALFFLEHTPVITLGMRGRAEHIRSSAADLQARGIDRVSTSRGGEVTLHAPGQLILYPILQLTGQTASAGDHVRHLEEIGIRTAADFGLAASGGKGANKTVTVSLGVTQHRSGESVNALLARADAALYRAKDGGRNRTVSDSDI